MKRLLLLLICLFFYKRYGEAPRHRTVFGLLMLVYFTRFAYPHVLSVIEASRSISDPLLPAILVILVSLVVLDVYGFILAWILVGEVERRGGSGDGRIQVIYKCACKEFWPSKESFDAHQATGRCKNTKKRRT